MNATKLSRTTRAAIRKYGYDVCVAAFDMHASGFGAHGVALEGGFDKITTTQAADAAINAGREISKTTEAK